MKQPSKVVFITDADSRSGSSIVRRFAAEGTHFILNSPSEGEHLQACLDDCRSSGCRVRVVNVNLCRSSAVDLMLEEAAQELGCVDVLIHNQNRILPASVETCDEALFLDILNTNAKSAFICTQVVGRQMTEGRPGKIVFINSIHADKPTGSSFAYSVSKAAVKLLAREAALALGRYGVNVNTIELGPVEGDDETFKSRISSLYDHYRHKVPNAVLGRSEDLANAVWFLASDEAHYVNGAELRLDGGFVLHYMDQNEKSVARRRKGVAADGA